MVKLISSIASLLAFGQAIAVANAVSSFSEWVDGIIENPQGDHMSQKTSSKPSTAEFSVLRQQQVR